MKRTSTSWGSSEYDPRTGSGVSSVNRLRYASKKRHSVAAQTVAIFRSRGTSGRKAPSRSTPMTRGQASGSATGHAWVAASRRMETGRSAPRTKLSESERVPRSTRPSPSGASPAAVRPNASYPARDGQMSTPGLAPRCPRMETHAPSTPSAGTSILSTWVSATTFHGAVR